MNSFAPVRKNGLVSAMQALVANAGSDDPMARFNASHNPFLEEHNALSHLFVRAGCDQREAGRAAVRFWDWERNKEMPHHRISSYLFAGVARRVAGGQRRVGRGFINDVRAISTYAPYVDAMFVDSECAELLREGRLRDELQYRAKIFSFADTDDFLNYLQGLEARATEEVRVSAALIYGLEV